MRGLLSVMGRSTDVTVRVSLWLGLELGCHIRIFIHLTHRPNRERYKGAKNVAYMNGLFPRLFKPARLFVPSQFPGEL